MIRIAIICLLISLVSSKKCDLSKDDLNELTDKLFDYTKNMENILKNEDAIVVLGLARCGKSTLINYLMGNKLKGEKSKEMYPKLLIVKDNMNSIGPEIGAGSTSKTKVCSKWNSTIFPEMVLWDTPGFDDNRGLVQDITNSVNIYHLLNNLKSVKVVLVVSQSDIVSDSPEQFLSFLNYVSAIFGDKFEHIFTGISLIFSKAPEKIDGIEIDVNYVSGQLQTQFLSAVGLYISETNKHFLQHMLNNTDRIGFFRKANKEGVLNNIDINIINAIRNSKSTILTNTHPSMAENSKLCLIGAQEEIIHQLYNHEEKVRIEIEKTINHTLDELGRSSNDGINDSIQKSQIELNRIYKILNESRKLSNDLPGMFNILRNINKDIDEKIDSFDLPSNIKLVKFVDEMLNTAKLKETDFYNNIITETLVQQVSTALASTMLTQQSLSTNKTRENILEMQKKMDKLDKLDKLLKLNNELKEKTNKTGNTDESPIKLNKESTETGNTDVSPELNTNYYFIPLLGAIIGSLILCFFFMK